MQLKNTLLRANNAIGSLLYDNSLSYKANGQLLIQSSEPNLFNTLGLIPDSNFFGTWTSVTPVGTASSAIQNNGKMGLGYGNGLYLAFPDAIGAGNIYTSSNTVEWTVRTSGTSSVLNDVTYGNGLYVSVGVKGATSRSTDGITWTATAISGAPTLNSVIYGNALYVCVGQSGAVYTSANAITWTSRTSGTSAVLMDVCYGGNLYVAVGEGGTILTSANAITWTSRTSGQPTKTLNCIAHNGSRYIVGANAGVILTSTDAITWSTLSYSPGALVHIEDVTSALNNCFVLSTDQTNIGDPMVIHSTDGLTWSSVLNNPTSATRTYKIAYNSDSIYGNTIIVDMSGNVTPPEYSASFTTYDKSIYFKLPILSSNLFFTGINTNTGQPSFYSDFNILK